MMPKFSDEHIRAMMLPGVHGLPDDVGDVLIKEYIETVRRDGWDVAGQEFAKAKRRYLNGKRA